MLKFAAVLALAIRAENKINEEFDDYLTGKKPMDDIVEEHMWSEFKNEFESVSSNTDEAHRKKYFMESLEYIIMNNVDPKATYKKGINNFTDLSDQEFMDYF